MYMYFVRLVQLSIALSRIGWAEVGLIKTALAVAVTALSEQETGFFFFFWTSKINITL